MTDKQRLFNKGKEYMKHILDLDDEVKELKNKVGAGWFQTLMKGAKTAFNPKSYVKALPDAVKMVRKEAPKTYKKVLQKPLKQLAMATAQPELVAGVEAVDKVLGKGCGCEDKKKGYGKKQKKTRKNKGKMPSNGWVQYVKEMSKKLNLKYGEALKDPRVRDGFKSRNKSKGKGKSTSHFERLKQYQMEYDQNGNEDVLKDARKLIKQIKKDNPKMTDADILKRLE